MHVIFINTSILLLALLFAACEAPRKNILDPKSPDHPYGSISGSVESYTLSRALENVNILWNDGLLRQNSDNTGSFSFNTILPEDGWLYFQKDGFFPDSIAVAWDNRKAISLAPVRMNAMPAVTSLEIFSAVLNKPGSIPSNYFFGIELTVTDEDNDIEEIRWEIPALDSSGVLKFDFSDGQYKFFSNSTINRNQFSEVMLHDFFLTLEDQFGRQVSLGNNRIRRVISEEIVCSAPIGNVIINNATPLLQWAPYDPGFSHTYRIEIFKRDGIFVESTPFWTHENIPGGQSSFQMDTPLDVSEYTWVVWAVDEFNNRIRSPETQFEYRP